MYMYFAEKPELQVHVNVNVLNLRLVWFRVYWLALRPVRMTRESK